MTKDYQNTSIRIEKSIYQEIKKLAIDKNTTAANIITESLREYLEKNGTKRK